MIVRRDAFVFQKKQRRRLFAVSTPSRRPSSSSFAPLLRAPSTLDGEIIRCEGKCTVNSLEFICNGTVNYFHVQLIICTSRVVPCTNKLINAFAYRRELSRDVVRFLASTVQENRKRWHTFLENIYLDFIDIYREKIYLHLFNPSPMWIAESRRTLTAS